MEFRRMRGVRERGEWVGGREGWEEEDGRRQEEERREKIVHSRYNKWYREIVVGELPKYLKAGWGEARYGRIARFRLGNEMRGGRYWEEEEERKCRVCGGEEETWEHVLDRCSGEEGDEKGVGEKIREILGEEGNGEEWMKRWEGKRREREEERGKKGA